MILAENRHTDQWNRIESSEINPYRYQQLIYNKGAKNIQWRKIVSSVNNVGKTGLPHIKRKKLNYYLTPHTKINSEYIKDLNVRPETIKLLEENIGNTFFVICLSSIFLDLSFQARETNKNK